jgi:hypothetical protein
VEPAWSPDGSTVVFTYLRQGSPNGHELFSVAANGGTPARLTNDDATDSDPDWQPLDRPPECEGVDATPASLRPPNGHFKRVSLSGATDPDGDAVAIAIDGVTQDEPVGHHPDARRESRPFQVGLRASREPRGDGRVYRIAFSASDHRGGECEGIARVEVRRKKKQAAIDSAPPSYDSFGP